ncbi:MAG: DinB family protein, partial [Anaerolineae bacterium]|nr:DinB family protein [Anaerolineae bacterium]
LHLLDTEWSWRYLIQSIGSSTELKEFDSTLWPELKEADFPTLASFEAFWREEEAAMRAYLTNLSDDDLERHLRYKVDSGTERDRVLWHCLLHLVNHGTQHRSEAAALLTEYGHSPGDLDFTVFLNEYSLPSK